MILLKEELLCLVAEFFNRRSISNTIDVSFKILLSWLSKVEMKLEKSYTFILPEGQWEDFGDIGNKMIEVAILWKFEFIRGKSQV